MSSRKKLVSGSEVETEKLRHAVLLIFIWGLLLESTFGNIPMAEERHTFDKFSKLSIYIEDAFGGGYNASVSDIRYRMSAKAFSTEKSEAIRLVKEKFIKAYYATTPDMRENFGGR